MLDSASIDDARRVADLGFVWGITTNPTLMAKEGTRPLEQLAALLKVFPGPVFYQPAARTAHEASKELDSAIDLAADRIIPKLPARVDFVALATDLASTGTPCALTAVYSTGQALLAAAAGVTWVIPYVNRASRLAEHGERLVADIATLLAAAKGKARILAASLKSPDEAIQAMLDGAHAVSVPLEVLEGFARHELTDQAIEEFAQRRAGDP